jgi:hypothetical protein
MNVYRRAIVNLGLTDQSQGRDGFVYLMLAALDSLETANPTADIVSSPWEELLYRLSDWADSPAYQELETMIGSRISNPGKAWV